MFSRRENSKIAQRETLGTNRNTSAASRWAAETVANSLTCYRRERGANSLLFVKIESFNLENPDLQPNVLP